MLKRNAAPFRELAYPQQLRHLRSVGRAMLKEYGLADVSLELIRYQHHAVYRIVTSKRERFLLRIAVGDRDSPQAFEAQVAWQEALWQDHLPVPEVVRTLGGRLVGSGALDASEEVRCALVRWAPGRKIGKGAGNLVMKQAGAIVARFHEHSRRSKYALGGNLPRWDAAAIGEPERWTADMNEQARATVCMVAHMVQDSLLELDVGPDSFGVIHADLHIGNLVHSQGRLAVIDFGDCGLGFYLYDLAIMVEVLRYLTPCRAEALAAAYLEGYGRVAALSQGAATLFPTFLVFRELINMKYMLESRNWKTQRWASRWVPESTRRLETYVRTEGQTAGGPFSVPTFLAP